MLQRDYLLRLIEQAANAIAKALGLLEKGDVVTAEQEINGALSDLTNMDRQTFVLLDSKTLAPMLGPPKRVRAVARICLAAGKIHERKGDPGAALTSFRRAIELYREVGPGDETDDLLAIRELSARFTPKRR